MAPDDRATAWERLTALADLQNERAAIQREPALPAAGTAERAGLDQRHAAMCAGLLAASRRL